MVGHLWWRLVVSADRKVPLPLVVSSWCWRLLSYNTLHAGAVLHRLHPLLISVYLNFSFLSTTPSYLSFSHNEHLIVDATKNHFAMNFHNTYVNCISMFSFNINIWIHSFFDAKRLIGRNSDDDGAQSDFRVSSNPRFVWNIEERKKDLYVVSFFRLLLVLTSFI